MLQMTSFLYELPSGTYCIGDPLLLLQNSYLIDEDICPLPGVYTCPVSFRKYIFGYTGFIEGYYQDAESKTYIIQNGLLGLIPVELCDPYKIQQFGHVKYYAAPILFYTDGTGYFEIVSSNDTSVFDTRINIELLQKEDEDYDY